MSVEEQDYQLEVLEYAVNQCIDRLLPSNSEDALSVILYQSNEVVWKVATEIYSKSGHQIDFIFVRNILNLRVEPLRRKIAEDKKIRAEQERIRKEKEAEQESIRKQNKETKQNKIQQIIKIYPNIDINIFFKIKKIIVEVLMVEEEQVKPDSILSRDLGADTLDIVELIQEIEEEFDIKIPDNFTEIHWISGVLGDYSRLESITVKEVLDVVCEKI